MGAVVITLDERQGSGDLRFYLQGGGCPVKVDRLEYGDVAMLGKGPEGRPVAIGVEVKTISDLINSMLSGRFVGHQLPGLINTYEVGWLLIEGIWKPKLDDGMLHVRQYKNWFVMESGRKVMYKELDKWLMTLTMRTGIHVWRTGDRYETAQWLKDLYAWWNDKEWEEHKSLDAFNKAGLPHATLVQPGLVQRVAKELPGLGWEKSLAVSKRFKSVMEMVMAEKEEWKEIEGVGETMAGRIIKALEG